MVEKDFTEQVDQGDRFEFGKNWNSFLENLDDDRIQVASDSLKTMLELESFEGKSFLDIGCGSGLFSLAASQLSASKIHSVDFDPDSVKCAQYLRDKYSNQTSWIVEKQSVLDDSFMSSLEKYDIVYSWGVLHHTGNMEKALKNITKPVKEGGLLFIAIYNDQGSVSRRWLKLKQLYNSGFIGRITAKSWYYSRQFFTSLISDLIRFRNPKKRYDDYKKMRGMSMLHDWKDWIGGLPFEVATPEFIFRFFQPLGFRLKNFKTVNGSGCNEFIFIKDSSHT